MTELHVTKNSTKSYDFTAPPPAEKPLVIHVPKDSRLRGVDTRGRNDPKSGLASLMFLARFDSSPFFQSGFLEMYLSIVLRENYTQFRQNSVTDFYNSENVVKIAAKNNSF